MIVNSRHYQLKHSGVNPQDKTSEKSHLHLGPMQRDPSFFDGKVPPTDAYGTGVNVHSTPFGGHYTYGAPVPPAFGVVLAGTKHCFCPSPLNAVELEPTETCPKNFIIFDQTEKKSRVMFHPALADKFNCHSNLDFGESHAHEDPKATEQIDGDNQISYLPKEDTEDINALLSFEEDDEEDDVLSTGRTPSYWIGHSSQGSLGSDEGLKCTWSEKSLCSGASSSSASSRSGRKRERMRKMVKVLRGIIPGGEVMDTPAVLDEAVNYLKSLKVEVKKLGMHNFKD